MEFTGTGHQPNLQYSLHNPHYENVDRVNGIVAKQINSLGQDLSLTSKTTGGVLIGNFELLKAVKATFERLEVPKIFADVLTEHGSVSPAVTKTGSELHLDYSGLEQKVMSELISHLQKNVVDAVGTTPTYKIKVGLAGSVVKISGEPKILLRTAALLAKMQKKS